MATVDVSEIALTRSVPSIPARVQVSEIAIFRAPPDAPPATVQVSGLWLTRGFEPPISAGGVRRREGGTWVEYVIKARFNGEWI